MEKKKYQEALPLLNDYIQRDTMNSDAYAFRGRCWRQIGNYKNSLIDLHRAVELNPSNEKAFSALGSTYAMLKQFDKALSSFDKSIQINPNYAVAYSSRGALYCYFLGKHDRGLDDYNRSIALEPNKSEAYYNRAIEYGERGMNKEALADLTIAAKLQPKDHLILHQTAVTYMASGEYKKAIRNFKKSIKYNTKKNPFEKLNNRDLYDCIGKCYRKLGKERKARKYDNKNKGKLRKQKTLSPCIN